MATVDSSNSTSSSPPAPPSSSTSPSPTSSNSSPPPPSAPASPPPPEQDDSSSESESESAPAPDVSSSPESSSPPPPPPSKSGSPSSMKSPSPPSSGEDGKDDSSGSSLVPPSSSSGSPSKHDSPTSALPKSKSSSSKSDSSSSDSGTSVAEKATIAGVAAGAVLLLVVMILLVFCCCCRKKKRKGQHMHYYNERPPRPNKTNGYYNNEQYGNWNTQGNGKDGPYNVPPPPGPGGYMSTDQWQSIPSPPPPAMMSGEMSSTGFSGAHHAPMPPPHPSVALVGFNKSTFMYEDLAAATRGFARENLLGQGGFGYVHKGVLPSGKEIAVKSLKAGSGQGEREFQAEVEIISRVHHRHLVSLEGYCILDSQRMLVYEFVPNNTLEHHLHGKGHAIMDFQTRLKIALGSAKGFAYLHEDCHPRIIHRDIKAANILLDEHFEAKVADFGLAKLSNDNHTHVSTRIMGTFGYLAPEYASSGKLTEKSDVYSFGIVLLELITGKRPVDIHSDDDSLVDWARPILNQVADGGSFDELVDPTLEGNYNPQEMLRMVASAAACIRHSARRRPKMSQIVRALEGDASLEDLNEGMKTGSNSVFGSTGSFVDGSYGGVEAKRVRNKSMMSSQEFTSSEHAVTGEFLANPSPRS
ncbi:proline-rich receptor-like protein kinase PERK7 [Diospyros lotus]|uniref:proline-rich receptor-like protein kinase PERK7 n=1 Tax=Diospyros lotus TaxID=55363 RepID=UPI0022512813|nr:proline-rich receptor-like protein kinase PERK7 [Diospyros lotus]